jgi:hypothetical protein
MKNFLNLNSLYLNFLNKSAHIATSYPAYLQQTSASYSSFLKSEEYINREGREEKEGHAKIFFMD